MSELYEMPNEVMALDLGASTYAGAVVLVLNGLLQEFRNQVKGRDEWNNSEPLFGGRSVGAILAASANNFRHNEEWQRDSGHPKDIQLPSIKVLAAALQEPIACDGADHQLGRHVCLEVLQLLSDGSFETLSRNVFAFAVSVVKRREASS